MEARRSSVLLYRTAGGLGDIVCAMAPLDGARERWPNHHIALALPKAYAQLAELHPAVSRVLSWGPVEFSRARLCKAVETYSDAFCLGPQSHNGHLAPEAADEREAHGRPRVSRAESFAHAIGVRAARPKVYLMEHEVRAAMELLRDLPKPRIVVAWKAASNPLRTLPVIREAGDILARGGAGVIHMDAKTPWDGEEEVSLQLLKRPLREIAAVLRCCDLVVSTDSGLLHLAYAVGTPVLGVFGPTDPRRTLKHAPEARWVWDIEKAVEVCGKPPCLMNRGTACAARGVAACVTTTPGSLAEAALEMAREMKGAPRIPDLIPDGPTVFRGVQVVPERAGGRYPPKRIHVMDDRDLAVALGASRGPLNGGAPEVIVWTKTPSGDEVAQVVAKTAGGTLLMAPSVTDVPRDIVAPLGTGIREAADSIRLLLAEPRQASMHRTAIRHWFRTLPPQGKEPARSEPVSLDLSGLRILHVASSLYPPCGGAERSSLELLAELAGLGAECLGLCWKDDRGRPHRAPWACRVDGVALRSVDRDGIADAIRASSASLVITHGSEWRHVEEAARQAGVPVVVFYRCVGQYSPRDLKASRCDVLAAPSEWAADRAGRHARREVAVIEPNPPGPPIGWKRDGGAVGMIRPSPAKGQNLFARLADIIGDYEFAALDPRRPIPNVRCVPRATDLDEAWWPLLDILLVPSTQDETFGRVAREASLRGVATIVSDRGGLPDAAGVGAVVLGPLETRAWESAVRMLMENPEERQARAAASAARPRRADLKELVEPCLACTA